MYQDKIYGVIANLYLKGNDDVKVEIDMSMDLCYEPYKQWIDKTIDQPWANAAFRWWWNVQFLTDISQKTLQLMSLFIKMSSYNL